jgi:hypothetical protein
MKGMDGGVTLKSPAVKKQPSSSLSITTTLATPPQKQTSVGGGTPESDWSHNIKGRERQPNMYLCAYIAQRII